MSKPWGGFFSNYVCFSKSPNFIKKCQYKKVFLNWHSLTLFQLCAFFTTWYTITAIKGILVQGIGLTKKFSNGSWHWQLTLKVRIWHFWITLHYVYSQNKIISSVKNLFHLYPFLGNLTIHITILLTIAVGPNRHDYSIDWSDDKLWQN